jgi:hypothetical protein
VTSGGNLCVKPAPLTVKADDKTITEHECLPQFTSTITGFKNGDQLKVYCGPFYLLSPFFFTGCPGYYKIIPFALIMADSKNYDVSYVWGTLTVKQKSTRYNTRSQKDATTVTFDTSIPLSVLSGGNDANASISGDAIAKVGHTLPTKQLPGFAEATVYPNPVQNKVLIQVSMTDSLSERGVIITDLIGRVYPTGTIRKINIHALELDLANFRTGVYFIRIKVNDSFKMFRIIKM